MTGHSHALDRSAPAGRLADRLGGRCVVLVGMMGAGKTTVGRRLAARLGIGFVDADAEIEKAAGQSIADIFEQHGEAAFRAGEQKVIARLLEEGPRVVATGGGAFINDETRARVLERGVALWLRADFDVLMERVKRRNHRPLLRNANPRQVMRDLIAERYPVYEMAPVVVQSRDVPHDVIVNEALEALEAYLDRDGHDG